jgi:hypothetical protein
MDIIKKDRNHIFFNKKNPIIPDETSDEEEDLIDRDKFLAEQERVRNR